MIDDIIILDDFICQQYQDDIEQNLLGDSRLPWYVQDDVTMGFADLPSKNFGLSHVLKNDQGITSNLYQLTIPMVYTALDKLGYRINNVFLARSFLQIPSGNNKPNWPHTDLPLPHTVCLYYVNNSQGDTVLYNETSDSVSATDVGTYQFTEYQRVTPKKGRAVIFNGNRYHSSSSPTMNKRCILNFDLNVKQR